MKMKHAALSLAVLFAVLFGVHFSANDARPHAVFGPETVLAQSPCTTSPNLGLQIPNIGNTTNWGNCINYDFTKLDLVLGGVTPLAVAANAPTIGASTNYLTANTFAVPISNFIGGYPGQTIRLFCSPSDVYTSLGSGTYIAVSSPWSCATASSISLTLVGSVWTENSRWGGGGSGGSSIFNSFQFGTNTSITGSGNYVQLTASPSQVMTLTQTGSGAVSSPFIDTIAISVQGSDTKLLSSGTISGTLGALLCLDANGGASTSGCSAGGVTAVTASTPLVSSGGNTPNLTCPTCAITSNPLNQFASTTPVQLASVITSVTGTGPLVFGTNPTFTTPTLGSATATQLTIGIGGPVLSATGTTLFLGNPNASVTSSGALTVTSCTGCTSLPTIYYQTIDANGTAQTQRPTLNFIAGSNITFACADNSGSGRTDCTITSSATAATAWSAITPATNSNAGNFLATGNSWSFSGATGFTLPTVGALFPGSGTGTVTVVAQATAGSPTLTLPNASGTFAVSASAPLALSATTGGLTVSSATTGALGVMQLTTDLGGTATSPNVLGLRGIVLPTLASSTGVLYDNNGTLQLATLSTVTSVSGTANQISVATGTTTPVISFPTAVTFPGTIQATTITATTGLIAPGSAGAIPTADGSIADNTTIHALVVGSNGSTVVLAAAGLGTTVSTSCSSQVVTTISAVAAPTCSTLTSAFLPATVVYTNQANTYTSGTQTIATGASLTFSGSGTINASTLGGATFASPGAIGGTTAAAGTFTALSATTSFILNGSATITSVHGTDTSLLSAGTISGTSVILCTDASGGATTVSCPSPGSGTVTGSGFILGYPMSATSSGTGIASSALYIDASQFTGSDGSLKIQNALAGCSTANEYCFIDARSVQAAGSSATWTANPLANITSTGGVDIFIKLGCYQILTNVSWTTPSSDVQVEQCGLHNNNSVLQGSSGFPASTPLISIGNGTNAVFNTMFQNMRLSCGSAPSSCFIFKGQLLQERAGLAHVYAVGKNSASATSPLAECIGCTHETFEDLELYESGNNDALLLDGNNVVQEAQGNIRNISANNTGFVQGVNGIHLQDTGASGSTYYTAQVNLIHAENFATSVNFDSQSAGAAVDTDCSANCTNVLNINTTGYVSWFNLGSQVVGIQQVNNQTTGMILTASNFNRGAFGSTAGNDFLSGVTWAYSAKTANYTLAYSDDDIHLTGTHTLTIPAALPGTLMAKRWYLMNDGSGSWTVQCSTGNTNGSASVTLPANTSAIASNDGSQCEVLLPGSGGGSVTWAADLAGSTSTSQTIAALQGQTLTLTTAATSQMLAYNGSAWVNSYAGVNVDPQTGDYAMSCPTDRLGEIEFAITATHTFTLPQAGSTACLGSNISMVVRNAISSTAVLTIAATTSTFQPENVSSHTILPGGALFIYSDATSSTGNYHAIDVPASYGGVNVQTAAYTLNASDRNKIVIMNCSATCAATLPLTPPNGAWTAQVMSIGSTLATVSLNGLNFNGGATAPVLNKYESVEFRTDGSNYYGSAPLVASTNVTFTPAANGLSISASGSGGSPALSAVTASTVTTTIANGNFAETWTSATTTNTQAAFTLSEATAATGTNDVELAITTLAGSTAIPLVITDSLTGSQTLAALSITPTWNTSGVVAGALVINVTNTASGTASKLANFEVAGTSEWNVDKTGSSTQLGNLTLGASSNFVFGTNSQVASPTNGILEFRNNAGSSFTRIDLGGTTSSFPALQLSGAGLVAELADGSAVTTMQASSFLAGVAGTTAGSLVFANATSGSITVSPVTGALGAVTISLPDLTGTVTLTTNNLSVFAATTSAQLAGVLSDETGTGAAVFANTPTLVTPVIGAATGTSLAVSSFLSVGTAPTVTPGTAGGTAFGTGTAPTGASATVDIYADSTGNCLAIINATVNIGCAVGEPVGLTTVQTVSGADYTNSTVTPSTVFSWTLPATAAAKNYTYTCDIMWESTGVTLVGPVFGVNISAAPTQLTAAGSVQNALAGADVNGYLSNTTTGSQTLVTSTAAGATTTNYWAKIWGTIEGAPTAGSNFIINAASTSGTTATLNVRRGSSCKLEVVQ
jgi:hypothetical protein